jgi:hypothetical protein
MNPIYKQYMDKEDATYLDAILAGSRNDLAAVELQGRDRVIVSHGVEGTTCADVPYL